jgi:hypothetical protein
MYIASSKVVGCLMAESISQAFQTVLLPRDAAHDAGQQMAPAEEPPAADVSNLRSRGDAFVSVGRVFAGQGGASALAGGVAQELLGSVREGGVGVNGANEGVKRPPVKEKAARGGLNGLRVKEDAASEGAKASDVEKNATSNGVNGPSVVSNLASKGVNGPRMLAVNAAANEGMHGFKEIAGGAGEGVNADEDTAKGSVTGIKERENGVRGTETVMDKFMEGARAGAGGERSLVGMHEHSRDGFQQQGQAAVHRAGDGAQPKAGPRGPAELLRGEVRRGVRFSERCRAARAGTNAIHGEGKIEAQGSSWGKTDDTGQCRKSVGRMAGYGHHLQLTGTVELLHYTGRSGQDEISVGIWPLSSAGGAELRVDPVGGWLESMGQRQKDDADGPAGELEERPSDRADHPQTAAGTLPTLVSSPEATPSTTPVPASPEPQNPLLPPLLGQPLLQVPNRLEPLCRGPASQQAARIPRPLHNPAKGTPNPPERADAASISQEPSESPKALHIAGAPEPPHIAMISQRRSETPRAAGRPSLYSQLMSASGRKRVKSEKQASEGKELATAGAQQQALVCRTEPVRAACGVRAIWVRKAERRKGVATALLDAMRYAFVHEKSFHEVGDSGVGSWIERFFTLGGRSLKRVWLRS